MLVRLKDTCSACQAYGHLECLFVKLMDTYTSACLSGLHSQCLLGLWTLAVLV